MTPSQAEAIGLLAEPDLQDELKNALDDKNFSFSGTFYHASLLPHVPNPCLQISGLGLIGLPLNEREAQHIISSATLAPFGHGERTVVDKAVRDTWEVEPDRVTFANPEWEAYLKSTVVTEVCKSLGVTVGNHPPKLELYKLLLYETGSHFLPHQDTQKANGMFATVIIILPSAYTGGQVVVSHDSTTKTIDFAPNSLLSTALLAWYTDVKHEVKEVTSGYRLALSYNLIHDNSSDPCPALPQMDDSVIALRRILQKWKDGVYEAAPDRQMIAYVLQHQYSTANLRDGLRSLKGVDAHRTTFLRPVAEQLGFRVGLGSLAHKVSGCGDDLGDDYYRRRYGDRESTTPKMLEVIGTSTRITGLVDLDGRPLIDVNEVFVGSTELIPKDPFKGTNPDKKKYEGYLGNGAGQLDHWYHRTVLLLMPEDRIEDICFCVEGSAYAYKKLKESSSVPPTQADLLWADRLMQTETAKKDKKRRSCAKKEDSLTKDHVVTLMDYAMRWKDLARWKDVMNLKACSLEAIGNDALLRALDIFSFDEVHVTFEKFLEGSYGYAENIEFLLALRAKAVAEENQVVLAWYAHGMYKILSSFRSYTTYARPKNVPTIVKLIQVIGIQLFKDLLERSLFEKGDRYEFCIALVKYLRDNRQTILCPNQSSSSGSVASAANAGKLLSEAAALEDLILRCLQAAVPGWSNVYIDMFEKYLARSRPEMKLSLAKPKVDRILQIVEEAIYLQNLDICCALFSDVLQASTKSSTIFDEVYGPLVPRLRELLDSNQIQLLASPFVDFFQAIIGLYLRDVLGKKMRNTARLRRIGCGCADCIKLDRFISDSTDAQTSFYVSEDQCDHLEERLRRASDICTYAIVRSEYRDTLEVTKVPEVAHPQQWPVRQEAARKFLSSLGPDDFIVQVMGSRFKEVERALEGIRAYRAVETTVDLTSPASTLFEFESTNAKTWAAEASTSDLHTVSSQAAGARRKRVEQVEDDMDTTEDN